MEDIDSSTQGSVSIPIPVASPIDHDDVEDSYEDDVNKDYCVEATKFISSLLVTVSVVIVIRLIGSN